MVDPCHLHEQPLEDEIMFVFFLWCHREGRREEKRMSEDMGHGGAPLWSATYETRPGKVGRGPTDKAGHGHSLTFDHGVGALA